MAELVSVEWRSISFPQEVENILNNNMTHRTQLEDMTEMIKLVPYGCWQFKVVIQSTGMGII